MTMASTRKPAKKGCPSGKERFRTEHDAMMAVTNAKIVKFLGGRRRRREIRHYACPDCWGWHLTSKPTNRFTRPQPEKDQP